MLYQIIAIVWKDLKILVRDRSALAVLFAMPMGFVLVMTTALGGVFGGGGDGAIPVLVVNEDKGQLAAQIVEGLKAAEGFKVETEWDGQPLTQAKAEKLVIAGERKLAVLFPADFSRRVLTGAFPSEAKQLQTTTIQLMADPALPSQFTGPIIGTLQGLLLRVLVPTGVELLFEHIAPTLPAEQRLVFAQQAQQGILAGTTIEQITPPGMPTRQFPNTTQQNVPGYALFGVFFIAQTIALSLIREKQDGTFRRLLAAPLSKPALLLGKLLPYYAVNLVQVMLIFAAGIWVVPLLGNPPLELGMHPEGLVVVSLAAAAAASGLGLLIATVGKTAEQISGLSALIVVLMAAVGGAFVPTFIMPDFMQTVAKIVPHAWALQGYQDIMVRGYGLSEVVPEVGALLIFAAAFFSLALWRFRFD